MSRISPRAVPLVLGMLFALLIGTVQIGSAFGDNLPACQGTGSPNGVVIKMAGRVLPPQTLLRTANGAVCDSMTEKTQNLVVVTRTIIVSPVSNSDTSANGQALLAARTTALTLNPTSQAPVVIKLEPGDYNIGSTPFTMTQYLDLEGSGPTATSIQGSGVPISNTGTLVGTGNSRVSNLEISNQGGNTYSIALYTTSSAGRSLYDNVRLVASTGSNYNIAYYDESAVNTYFTNVLFQASGSGGATVAGIFTNQGLPNILDSEIQVIGNGAGSLYAAYHKGSGGGIYNNVRFAPAISNNGSPMVGIYAEDNAHLEVTNSRFQLNSFQFTNAVSYGLNLNNITGKVINSQIEINTRSATEVDGIKLVGASQPPVFKDNNIVISNTGTASVSGYNMQNTSPLLQGEFISVTTSTSDPNSGYGLGISMSSSGSPVVENSHISVKTAGSLYSQGIYATGTVSTTIRSSTIEAAVSLLASGTPQAFGINMSNAGAIVSNSTVKTSQINTPGGIDEPLIAQSSGASILVQNSFLQGELILFNNGGNTIRIAGSLFNASVGDVNGSPAGTICLNDYKADYTTITNGACS